MMYKVCTVIAKLLKIIKKKVKFKFKIVTTGNSVIINNKTKSYTFLYMMSSFHFLELANDFL